MYSTSTSYGVVSNEKARFWGGEMEWFWGKVEDRETIECAAIRECKEEAGLEVVKIDKRRILYFEFRGRKIKIKNVY